jgi:hypothetical protein
VEIRFQSPKPLGRGKARVLSKMYSSVGVLNLCPMLAVFFLAVLFFSSCQILSGQSYPACPVLPVLFSLSCYSRPVLSVCSAHPVLPIPLCLSYSACPVQPVLFCLSYSACAVLPVLFCLSCSAFPVFPVLFFCLSVLF